MKGKEVKVGRREGQAAYQEKHVKKEMNNSKGTSKFVDTNIFVDSSITNCSAPDL